mmetsp:Transcript_17439/g.49745  ORF Transcript_17439/g.49745 Transcript_17439/m.49745 type:complete len:322 (+) Transcript_17439:847-1812(+)
MNQVGARPLAVAACRGAVWLKGGRPLLFSNNRGRGASWRELVIRADGPWEAEVAIFDWPEIAVRVVTCRRRSHVYETPWHVDALRQAPHADKLQLGHAHFLLDGIAICDGRTKVVVIVALQNKHIPRLQCPAHAGAGLRLVPWVHNTQRLQLRPIANQPHETPLPVAVHVKRDTPHLSLTSKTLGASGCAVAPGHMPIRVWRNPNLSGGERHQPELLWPQCLRVGHLEVRASIRNASLSGWVVEVTLDHHPHRAVQANPNPNVRGQGLTFRSVHLHTGEHSLGAVIHSLVTVEDLTILQSGELLDTLLHVNMVLEPVDIGW